jgi:hypothetical protein
MQTLVVLYVIVMPYLLSLTLGSIRLVVPK